MTFGLSKRVGTATGHRGFGLKEELVAQLRAAGHGAVGLRVRFLIASPGG